MKININPNNKFLALGLLLIAAAAFAMSPEQDIDKEKWTQEAKNECGLLAVTDTSCYAKKFVVLAENEGPEFAFEVLYALQEVDSYTKACHLISHGIGEGTYKKSPSDWQKNMRVINQSCSYGAMHGIMVNYVASLAGGTLTAQAVKDLCGPEPFSECNHIVGHLLLVEMEADVDAALEFCRVLENIPRQVENCYNGVFMEYQTALNLIEHGLADESWLDWTSRIDELEMMCRNYDNLEAISCWRIIAHAVDRTFDHDPSKIFAFCETAHVQEAKRECKFHSIGILAAFHLYDFEKLKPICSIPQSDLNFSKDCYIRLAMTSLSSFPEKVQEARNYCSTIPDEYQKICLDRIGFYEQSAAKDRELPLTFPVP